MGLNNQFFTLLLEVDWIQAEVPQSKRMQFVNLDSQGNAGGLMMLFSDMIFRDDDKFRAIVEEYAQDNDLFLEDFRKAWIKLVNADRFGDVCVMSEPVETTTSPTKDSTTSPTKDSLVPQMEVKDMPSETSVTCENSQEASTLTWVLVI